MATRARENGQLAHVPLLSLALYHHETQFFVSQLFQALSHFSVSIFFWILFWGVACYQGRVVQVAVILPRHNVGVVYHDNMS